MSCHTCTQYRQMTGLLQIFLAARGHGGCTAGGDTNRRETPMKLAALLSVLAAMFLAGCANDGTEFGEEVGGTWGTGPWELPPQVKQAFGKKYPGATVAAWDQHNFEGGESVYDIVYHDREGQSHS